MRKNLNLHKLAYALEKRADFLEDAKNWIVDNPELAAGLLGGGLGAGAGALVPTEEGGGAGARVRNALIGALLGGGVGAGAGYLGKGYLEKGKPQKSPPSDGGKKEDTKKPRKTFFAEWGNDGQLHMTPTNEVTQEDIVKSLTSHNTKGSQGSDSTSDDEKGGNNFDIGGTNFPTNFMDAEDQNKEDKEKERKERLDAFFNRGMHMSPYSNQFFEDYKKAFGNGTLHLEQLEKERRQREIEKGMKDAISEIGQQRRAMADPPEPVSDLEREKQLREAVQNITNLINKGKEKVNNIRGRDVARFFFPGLVPPKK